MIFPINLGRYLFLEFVKDWFDLVDFCRFDTAVTHRNSRTALLANLSLPVAVRGDIKFPMFPLFFEWITARNICVDYLFFTGNPESNNVVEPHFPISVSSQIRKLRLVCSNETRMCGFSASQISKCHNVIESAAKLQEVYFGGLQDLSSRKMIDEVLHHCHYSLRTIIVVNCRLSQETMGMIAEVCSELRHLELSNCESVSDTTLVTIFQQCTKLHTVKLLNLGYGESSTHRNSSVILGSKLAVTDVAFQKLAEHCSQLTCFDINCCASITVKTMLLIIQNCSHLSDLNISGCFKLLTEEVLMAIGTHCREMKTLNLAGSNRITDHGVAALCIGCPHITSLNVDYSPRLTVVAYKYIASSLTKLKRISFRQFDGTKEQSLFKVLSPHFRRLHSLNMVESVMSGDPRITGETALSAAASTATQVGGGGASVHSKDKPIQQLVNSCYQPALWKLVCSSFEHLQSLTVGTETNGAVLRHILLLGGARLTTLDLLARTQPLTERMLHDISRSTGGLEVLSLHGNSMLDGKYEVNSAIIAVLQNNTSLTELNLIDCSRVSDGTVTALTLFCRKISVLRITNAAVTHKCIFALALRCKYLVRLELTNRNVMAMGTTKEHEMELRQNCILLEKCNIGVVDM